MTSPFSRSCAPSVGYLAPCLLCLSTSARLAAFRQKLTGWRKQSWSGRSHLTLRGSTQFWQIEPLGNDILFVCADYFQIA
jgi:hypothetical protein